jgi:hypothetical protein
MLPKVAAATSLVPSADDATDAQSRLPAVLPLSHPVAAAMTTSTESTANLSKTEHT